MLAVLLATLGVVLLATAVFVALRDDSEPAAAPPPALPNESSVEAGFARDMAAHHDQAVQMASYARDHAVTGDLRMLATEIEVHQQFEVGQMRGWLDAWGLQVTSNIPAMSWMGSHGGHQAGGPMPGMATPAEMDELVNLTGKPLEVRFLQLMIRHHEGGLPMAQHAAEHTALSYVRLLAAQMVTAQAGETDRMRLMLTERGGRPL